MKKVVSFLSIFVLLVNCANNDDSAQYEYVNVAHPILMSKIELRTSVEVMGPQAIVESGKIYYYNGYIFINEDNAGVHVIDNTNPSDPNLIAFIKIPGNKDVSIKDGFLFADSLIDLVVFDISDMNNIEEVNRLEDVFNVYNYDIPEGAYMVDFDSYDYTENVIVGWYLEEERIELNSDTDFGVNGPFIGAAESSSDVGVGGSLARFQIVDNFLYTVGEYELSIINISSLSSPVLDGSFYAGWNIETLFYYEDYLYMGGNNGMFIYDIHDRTNPIFMSEFLHWEGCDPVVVDGNYAYLTLRGGNPCGQMESVLEVIDISNKQNPTLVGQYSLENPYGLGYQGNSLFVCDGTAGLKIFNKANPLELQQLQNFEDVDGRDVIPLETTLLLVGDGFLNQYEYSENSINLLSTFSF
ncbi:LVIVD repeat-containing protein [Mangrovimonas futianensis]|uniref:LVIVD repeat-containing protein n=1 Tax=Mangrovimonas futianensis TaxID=2895523 RepID=UPI001E3F7808|nr:hypothetical protein [Mangrovimonas futianensis]MCF1422558.1 hypothetical protein [Mangrovimonas futianensis]